jgi:hypothetical protein
MRALRVMQPRHKRTTIDRIAAERGTGLIGCLPHGNIRLPQAPGARRRPMPNLGAHPRTPNFEALRTASRVAPIAAVIPRFDVVATRKRKLQLSGNGGLESRTIYIDTCQFKHQICTVTMSLLNNSGNSRSAGLLCSAGAITRWGHQTICFPIQGAHRPSAGNERTGTCN